LKAALTWLAVAAAALVATLALSACGSSKKSSSSSVGNTIEVSIAESGKTAKYSVPSSAKGGLATLRFTNNGKAPHSAQLVRIVGNHTPQEALKVIGSQSSKTPAWLRAEGGLGAVPPGSTQTATLDLEAGRYMVLDPPNGPSGPSGPPPFSQFELSPGAKGKLPSTPTTVTAAQAGKDKYRWDISGELKSGAPQEITFVSKGKDALHVITAVKVKGAAPSDAEIVKQLKSNGPPKFADVRTFTATAVIDGEKSQVTPISFQSPGKWVLFCELSDRDGGKSHFEEGLLKTVDVK
jgi:hypothetical protein